MSARLLAPIAIMGAIFWASAQPFTGPDLAWWEVVIRKLGHFTVYAALAAAWIWALLPHLGLRRAALAAAAISIAYAASDEYHQTFVEGRHGSPVDVGIDAAGVLAVVAVAGAVLGRERQIGNPHPGA